LEDVVALGNVRGLVWLYLGSLAALTACSGSTEGPLSFGGYGNTLVHQDAPPYFVVDVCTEVEPVSVTLKSVEAVHVSGTAEPITFRVAWSDGPPFERVISSHDPVPTAYVPVKGASGEIGTCGKFPDRYGALAVVFPPTKREPVAVQDLRITYEASDTSYTRVVSVSLTQCSKGTRPSKTSGKCDPRRAAR
jgi:hypothetical protein